MASVTRSNSANPFFKAKRVDHGYDCDMGGPGGSRCQLRRLEAETYAKNKAEQEKGLEGNKLAMSFLQEYNASDAAHDAAVGAANSILALLDRWSLT